MQIAEMRSSLEADHAKRKKFGEQFPTMPDWAVRRIFESRNGLPLTALPEAARRSASAFLSRQKQFRTVQATPVASQNVVTESEREAIQRRIRAVQISLLQ
jgi:hypothetical protein